MKALVPTATSRLNCYSNKAVRQPVMHVLYPLVLL